jgi:hypothetical protein
MNQPLSFPMAEAEVIHALVVSIDVARVIAVRHAACGWPMNVDVDWASTWHEAVRRARELPARLVIVDCDAGITESTALARHLSRHQPHLDVLAFAQTDGAQPPSDKDIAWPWSALPLVLDEWFDLQCQLHGVAAGSGV